jgi:hypothetical protein
MGMRRVAGRTRDKETPCLSFFTTSKYTYPSQMVNHQDLLGTWVDITVLSYFAQLVQQHLDGKEREGERGEGRGKDEKKNRKKQTNAKQTSGLTLCPSLPSTILPCFEV